MGMTSRKQTETDSDAFKLQLVPDLIPIEPTPTSSNSELSISLASILSFNESEQIKLTQGIA